MLAHALPGGRNAVDQSQVVVAKIRWVFPQQLLAESHDGTQRSTQIVGHGIAERFQLLQALFEFGGALGHQLFQAGVEFAEVDFIVLAIGHILHHAGEPRARPMGGLDPDPAWWFLCRKQAKFVGEPLQVIQAFFQVRRNGRSIFGVNPVQHITQRQALVTGQFQHLCGARRSHDGRIVRVDLEHAHAGSVQCLLQQPLVSHQFAFEFVALERHLDGGMQFTLRKRLEQVTVGLGELGALQS